MTSPLSPAAGSTLNRNPSPPSSKRSRDEYEVNLYSTIETESPCHSSDMSSPSKHARHKDLRALEDEAGSATNPKHARVLSGNKLSPLKILSTGRAGSSTRDANDENTPPRVGTSPRKTSPEKRFPVKISDSAGAARPRPPQLQQTHAQIPTGERLLDLGDMTEKDAGLAKAIQIFEDENSIVKEEEAGDSETVRHDHSSLDMDDAAAPDDTIVSTFSTFSAVPDMTMLGRLGPSPAKTLLSGTLGGKTRLDKGPHSSSPGRESSGSTNLLDFTEQFRFPAKQTTPRGSLSPSRAARGGGSPMRAVTNLIDFDLPPMPTPRSVPTISARELESLKSSFLSEISSLKASLSGKEAEVSSLKTAVGDAEMRVGKSMEQIREARAAKEQLVAEKEGWEARGVEMERVLRKAKEEIEHGRHEREELEQKLEENEKKREAAEMMHQEAESRIAGMRAGKEDKTSSVSSPGSSQSEKSKNHDNSKEVEMAVERVARELHVLYKNKHETKVAALKKSYETRWEKKIRELEGRIAELSSDNEKMKIDQDTTLLRTDPAADSAADVLNKQLQSQAAKDSAAMKELNADIQRLEAVVQTVQRDNEDLRSMLERERVEKGELVQLAEEMMNMQTFVAQTPKPEPQQQQRQQQQAQPPAAASASGAPTPRSKGDVAAAPAVTKTPAPVRTSGLRAPGTAIKGRTPGGGLPRPGGGVARSGIMSSIERMGSHRGRAAE